MRALAHGLSVLLHPVWMPTLLIVLGVALDPFLGPRYVVDQRLLLLYVVVFVMTVAFPLSSTWMLIRSGMVPDWQMHGRGDRVPVYLLTLLYYGMTYWLLRRTAANPQLLSIALGSTLVLVCVFLVNLRWKISAHMAGIGGVLGTLLALLLFRNIQAPLLLATAFIAVGALGSARLKVSDHSPAQVHAGTLLGVLVMGICVGYRLAL